MRKHQRYLPVRDARRRAAAALRRGRQRRRSTRTLVRAGNEAVLRARYEDAAFFYRADLRDAARARCATGWRDLTFTDRLGSMADRADRIAAIAAALAGAGRADRRRPRPPCDRAGELAKFDLGSQMVIELTSLAGTMAREYAARAGEPARRGRGAVRERAAPPRRRRAAHATSPARCWRWPTGSTCWPAWPPRSACPPAAPTRSGCAAPRSALLAVHRRTPPGRGRLTEALAEAAALQPVDVTAERAGRRVRRVPDPAAGAGADRGGPPVDRVRAVLAARRPARRVADRLLHQLDELIDRPEFRRLAETVQRARRIVPAGTPGAYDVGGAE